MAKSVSKGHMRMAEGGECNVLDRRYLDIWKIGKTFVT